MDTTEYWKSHIKDFYNMLISEDNPFKIRIALMEYMLSAHSSIGYPIYVSREEYKKENSTYDRANGLRIKIDKSNHSVVATASSNIKEAKTAIYECVAEIMAKAPWIFTWDGSGIVIVFLTPDLLSKLSKRDRLDISDTLQALLNYDENLQDKITVCFQPTLDEKRSALIQMTKIFSYYSSVTELDLSLDDTEPENENLDSLDNGIIEDEDQYPKSLSSFTNKNELRKDQELLNGSDLEGSCSLQELFKMLKPDLTIDYDNYEIVGDITEIERIIHPTNATSIHIGKIKSILSKCSSNYISVGYDEGSKCFMHAFRNALCKIPKPKDINKMWVHVFFSETLHNPKYEFSHLERFLRNFSEIETTGDWSINNSLDGQQAKVTVIVSTKEN